ncbi:MAG TPA: response regulator, partial [Thermoanaerobaculia bacterium]|nr:response regulator [Thermoanaerobaculia bacterium]
MSRDAKILIADDDQSMLRLLRHYLEPTGAEILTADNGNDALEIARKEMPDLVLLDVVMPGRSGWEICQTLKGVQRTSRIMVILLTGKGEVKDRLTGLQVGADDYVAKPFEKNDVTWRVGRLLDLAEKRRKETPPGTPPESLHNLLYDRATGLPTVSLILDRLREMLIDQQELGVIHVDVEQYESMEEEYGWAYFDEVLSRIAESIRKEADRVGSAELAVSRVGATSFY